MALGISIFPSASSSEHRRDAARWLLLGALAAAPLLALARPAAAQGTVSGVLTLEERPDEGHGDLRTAVVYLEVKGHVITNVGDAPKLRMGSIAMSGREFIPHVRVVLAGGTVAFPNEDPFSHNVFSNVDLGPFDLGLYRRKETRTAPFARPGVYPIYCNIHSKMVSFVVAVSTPWAAQPDAEGRFVIPDVPSGTYIVHAWHERGAAEARREIVVTPEGVHQVQLTIDARTYVDAPHLNKFGRPYTVIRADRY